MKKSLGRRRLMSERELYRAVLNQAYIDISSNVEKYREDVEEFIYSEDFDIVCQFADLSTDQVLLQFKKILK
jgi:hypothetical protein